MLSNKEIEDFLLQRDGVTVAEVEGDGYQYHLKIVASAFSGKSKVMRQKWVYQQLNEYITSGRLHALNMETFSQDEWEKKHG